jgi:hypothetical protein
MTPTSLPPETSPLRASKFSRWREAIVVLIVLAGVIALGVFGPDRSKPNAPPNAPVASQQP